MAARRDEVVITGASVLTAVADDLAGFTAALRAGRSGFTGPPVGAWLPDFSVAGWSARHLAGDPAAATRLRAATRRAALPARTAACVGVAAVRHARLTASDLAETGLVVAGNNLALDYHAGVLRAFAERPASVRPSHALTHLDTDAVGTVSEATGVAAEGWTAGAASASGTVAALLAARLVAAGALPACLVVAPVCELSAAERRAFADSGAMARSAGGVDPASLCRPFDRARRGFVPGQGAAAVVLERPERARRRGVPALAAVAGGGQRLDARRGTRPDPAGQAAALRAALFAAGVAPGEVDYVNAHGTGSVEGDAAEAAALAEVFGRSGRPLVNSTKPVTGHCLSAAGLVELVATVLQLRGGFVHGTPGLRDPLDPGLGLVGPAGCAATPRVAVSHSVAFSGINAALVLRTSE
ncbi:malonyl-ACP decarboxylase [Amycolatopsis arida]|uniref:Malonyl-ACP decarboxylase n=1 Tax=Amycolatopsis arida TaxID=587909 RepID=A0A1I6AK29_9PSEU|nr:beta-ketoacyl synthase N-terminal-like domain-containing protein [Amycolatopsis arida]TDX87341.1 malonyl-ACP decarboxylase [Amycolatopsis arida]SFQ69071.1 malonyl-ACP decarboxylase [Amycolatopsis arida]